jgi:D-alanyl-D-alanine carboxypeptidase
VGRVIAVTFFVIALVGTTAAPVAASSRHSRVSPDDRLELAMRDLVAKSGGPPGVFVVVQRDGVTRFHTAGVADAATGRTATIDDHERLASVAKAFSGAAALRLVSRGVLSLDDTIGTWLPQLPRPWHGVTLAQLLNHTSGISDFSKNDAFLDALFDSLLVAPPPETLLSYANDELGFRPGTKYRYSNSDNIVVGLIVAAATGMSYENALEQFVYNPMGLQNTSLPADAAMPTPFIHGYAVDPAQGLVDQSELFAAGWTWASGGIVSTPADANRFIRDYASGATIDAATRAQQFQFRKGSSEPPGPGKNAVGLGIFRYRTRCGTVYGHTGNTAGYTELVAATGDGSRSATVSINAQITPTTNSQLFPQVRALFELAVCAALG